MSCPLESYMIRFEIYMIFSQVAFDLRKKQRNYRIRCDWIIYSENIIFIPKGSNFTNQTLHREKIKKIKPTKFYGIPLN
jgi:hypothetical protein